MNEPFTFAPHIDRPGEHDAYVPAEREEVAALHVVSSARRICFELLHLQQNEQQLYLMKPDADALLLRYMRPGMELCVRAWMDLARSQLALLPASNDTNMENE